MYCFLQEQKCSIIKKNFKKFYETIFGVPSNISPSFPAFAGFLFCDQNHKIVTA